MGKHFSIFDFVYWTSNSPAKILGRRVFFSYPFVVSAVSGGIRIAQKWETEKWGEELCDWNIRAVCYVDLISIVFLIFLGFRSGVFTDFPVFPAIFRIR